jgi:hypothetical protein
MNPASRPTRTQVFTAFHRASQHLAAADIRHWIDFGTLLGAVREGGFIHCDQDVDFNFHQEDLPRMLEFRDLFRERFNLELFFDPAVNTVRWLPRHSGLDLENDQSAHRSCIDAGIPYADCYPCRSEGKWMRHPVSEYDFRSIYCRKLEWLAFEGAVLPSPQNCLSLLRHRYGSAWSRPLGRSEFDSQAQRLIEPFPAPMGCLLIVSDDVPPETVALARQHLTEDFDQVEFWLRSRQKSADNPALIGRASLHQVGCHFLKLLGEPAIALDPVLVADDVILN